MKDIFKKVASYSADLVGNGKAFLFGSVLTIYSGLTLSNDLVAMGGVGLAIGALMINRQKYQNAPYALLPANVVLTVNGVVLAFSGEPIAGTLLALSNSIVGYGTANLQSLLEKISPQSHGVISSVAGFQIAAAGYFLNDPTLATIGALFTADGVERTLRGEDNLRTSVSGAIRSLNIFS